MSVLYNDLAIWQRISLAIAAIISRSPAEYPMLHGFLFSLIDHLKEAATEQIHTIVSAMSLTTSLTLSLLLPSIIAASTICPNNPNMQDHQITRFLNAHNLRR
ncbi:hypothetical protein ANCCAN_01586 [Ancylostoma caninum]|uniref:Uncharacterized protein n=1 Tax=Ancylostoma caninum TaxID=29170 RepID=A0A368H6E2_ANCCA|nr:hypothetical protein ANCCAN_01586 [Ancylostoma caninum]